MNDLSEKTNQGIIDLIYEYILPKIEVFSFEYDLMTEAMERIRTAGVLPDSIQEALNSGDGVYRP